MRVKDRDGHGMTRVHGVSLHQGRRRPKPCAGAFVPVRCLAARVSGLLRDDVAHPDDAHAMAQILPLLRIRRANKPGSFRSRRDKSVRKDKETERKTL